MFSNPFVASLELLSKDQIGDMPGRDLRGRFFFLFLENSTPSWQRLRSKMPQERLTSKYLKFTPPNWMENYDWLIGYATWTRSYMTRIFQYINSSGVLYCNGMNPLQSDLIYIISLSGKLSSSIFLRLMTRWTVMTCLNISRYWDDVGDMISEFASPRYLRY